MVILVAMEPSSIRTRNSSYELLSIVRSIETGAPKPLSDGYEPLENCIAAVATVACARHRNGEAFRQSLGLLAIVIGKAANKPHVSHVGVKIMRGAPRQKR